MTAKEIRQEIKHLFSQGTKIPKGSKAEKLFKHEFENLVFALKIKNKKISNPEIMGDGKG